MLETDVLFRCGILFVKQSQSPFQLLQQLVGARAFTRQAAVGLFPVAAEPLIAGSGSLPGSLVRHRNVRGVMRGRSGVGKERAEQGLYRIDFFRAVYPLTRGRATGTYGWLVARFLPFRLLPA